MNVERKFSLLPQKEAPQTDLYSLFYLLSYLFGWSPHLPFFLVSGTIPGSLTLQISGVICRKCLVQYMNRDLFSDLYTPSTHPTKMSKRQNRYSSHLWSTAVSCMDGTKAHFFHLCLSCQAAWFSLSDALCLACAFTLRKRAMFLQGPSWKRAFRMHRLLPVKVQYLMVFLP